MQRAAAPYAAAERDEISTRRRGHGDDAWKPLDIIGGSAVVPNHRTATRDGHRSRRVASVRAQDEIAATPHEPAVRAHAVRWTALVVLEPELNAGAARPELKSCQQLCALDGIAASRWDDCPDEGHRRL
jgi:hypothetical protein